MLLSHVSKLNADSMMHHDHREESQVDQLVGLAVVAPVHFRRVSVNDDWILDSDWVEADFAK